MNIPKTHDPYLLQQGSQPQRIQSGEQRAPEVGVVGHLLQVGMEGGPHQLLQLGEALPQVGDAAAVGELL